MSLLRVSLGFTTSTRSASRTPRGRLTSTRSRGDLPTGRAVEVAVVRRVSAPGFGTATVLAW